MTSRIAESNPSPERSGRPGGALEQQRRLVPHQLAAPDAVGCAADGADVVTPDFRRREVRLALVERVQQSQDRLVLDTFEPLPRLRRLAGGRQVLKELTGLTGHARRPQRFDEQRAAAALRREHQICRRMADMRVSLTATKSPGIASHSITVSKTIAGLWSSSMPRSAAIADRLVIVDRECADKFRCSAPQFGCPRIRTV